MTDTNLQNLIINKLSQAQYDAATHNPNELYMTIDSSEPAEIHGIPSGGSTGQALKKSSNDDYDVTWGSFEPVDPTILREADVVDNVTSTITTEPLSANQGKLLNDRIDYLSNVGRFLSLWHGATGLPETNPTSLPYTYHTGDYYRVIDVDSTTNYQPYGSTYDGTASTTVYSGTMEIGDIFYFDGTTWSKQATGGGGTVQDVQVNSTSVVSGGVANITSIPGGIVSGAVAEATKIGSSTVGSSTLPIYLNSGSPTTISDLTLSASDTTDKKVNVTNSNGGVELLVSTNRGVYDRTNSKWIIYESKSDSNIYVPNWASIGSATQPVYINASGRPTACTAYSSATVSNSDMADGLHVHTGRNNEANKIVRTDGNGYIQCGYINSSNGDEKNNSNPSYVWGTNGSDSYLRTYKTSALSVNYAAYSNYATNIYPTGSSATQYLVGVNAYSASVQRPYIYSPCYMSGGYLYSNSTKVVTGVSKGSSTQPVYINSDGVATACTAYGSASVSYASSAGSAPLGGNFENLYSGSTTGSLSISSSKYRFLVVCGKIGSNSGTSCTVLTPLNINCLISDEVNYAILKWSGSALTQSTGSKAFTFTYVYGVK